MRSYITASGAAQVYTGKANKVSILVNTALTGTIGVIDGTSGTTVNVATITNPVAGDRFEYTGFTSGVRVNPSGTCDITVEVF